MDAIAKDGSTIRLVDHEHIQRSRLRVDARKWLMSKMAPKKYGEKLQHTGDGGGPGRGGFGGVGVGFGF